MTPERLEIPARVKNLVQALLGRAQSASEEAARYKVHEQWRGLTWGEILTRVRGLSEGLVALGVRPRDRVCLYAQTRLDWCLADLAVMGAGAVSVPIYASNTAKETEHIVNDCGARVVFFDHDKPEGRACGRWTRLKEVRPRTPLVEHYIGFDLASRPEEGLWSLADLEAKGASLLQAHPQGLEERAEQISGEDLSCILYTSGTAGTPKGVMLTHASWVAQAYAVMQSGVLAKDDLILLFLPLAHSFARLVEMCWMTQGVRLVFAESIERVVANAAEVQATILPAVPRVFEKAYNQVLAGGLAQTGWQGRLFRWAMAVFQEHVRTREAGQVDRSPQWLLARKLVFAKISKKLHAKFGGRMRAFVSGGAPLTRKIGYFFEACDLSIVEGYGLTETCAPTHANRIGSIRVGTVGLPLPGIEARIAEDGEILVRGPQVMKGYHNLPNETAQAITAEGWFCTGDVGEIDAQGRLRITDRKKDLFKTSGGKFIAPQELENALKAEPLISQVSIHGEGRKFVSALLAVSVENAKQWADENHVDSRNVTKICQHPDFRARLQETVDALNATLPAYATIKKFAIVDHEWSQETGELTPTLKVKRAVIEQRYQTTLDELYDEPYEG